MKCEQFENLVHDLAKEKALDAATVESALTHAEGCAACDSLMEEAESLNLGLDSLAARYATEHASPRVEKALLEAFGRQIGERAAPARKSALSLSWIMSAAGVAAAAILFVSLTFHSNLPQPGGLPTPQVAAAADPANELEAEVPTEASEADSFTSLSSTFDAASLEDDAVVRVVLSDAALESFGVPVNETGHGQVIADLVVASDGAPQAIRVVGW